MTHEAAITTVFWAKKATKRLSKYPVSVSVCYLRHLDSIPKMWPFKLSITLFEKMSQIGNQYICSSTHNPTHMQSNCITLDGDFFNCSVFRGFLGRKVRDPCGNLSYISWKKLRWLSWLVVGCSLLSHAECYFIKIMRWNFDLKFVILLLPRETKNLVM